MKLLKQILVATDFTPGSRCAFDTAIYVAKQFQSEIVLLHVVPGKSERYLDATSMIAITVKEELLLLAEEAETQGVHVSDCIVDFGVPFNKIDEQANKLDVNFIVMGARDDVKEKTRRLGSTAAEVRRSARKPVWIVRPGAEPVVNNVLCCLEFTEASERALRNAIHLSRILKSDLTVLAVNPHVLEDPKRSKQPPEYIQDDPNLKEKWLVRNYLKNFDFHEVNHEVLTRQGVSARLITDAIRQKDIDLFVTGTRAGKGLSRLFVGEVGGKVAKEMPCSIVTFKSEHAIRPPEWEEKDDADALFNQGHELLAMGFPNEAIRMFQRCIAKDEMYEAAWEGLAAAHERMGRSDEAKICEEEAQRLVEALKNREIEDDIRGKHILYKPLFGIDETEK
jgi:universal stress protein E